MAAPPPRIQRLALDFHRTLVDWADLVYTTRDVLDFPDFFAARSFRDPDWLRGFLVNVHRSGVKLFVISKQENRFDGMAIEQIRAVQRAEQAQGRRFNGEELDAQFPRDPSKFMGGRRLIATTLDLLFDGDTALRSSVLPDSHIVLYDDLPLPRPFNKVAQLDSISGELHNRNRRETVLFDDNDQELLEVQEAGYLGARVEPTQTLTQEFWVLKALSADYGYPEFAQLQQQVLRDIDYDLSRGVIPPAMQMLSIANQLSILAIAGVEALAKLSAAAADELGDFRASIRRPIQGILDSYYALHTSQRAQFKDTREVLAEALNAYMEAAAQQSYDRHTRAFTLKPQLTNLVEFAERHSVNAYSLRRAFKKMEKARVEFINSVRALQESMPFDEISHDPHVLDKRRVFFQAAESVGRWL